MRTTMAMVSLIATILAAAPAIAVPRAQDDPWPITDSDQFPHTSASSSL